MPIDYIEVFLFFLISLEAARGAYEEDTVHLPFPHLSQNWPC